MTACACACGSVYARMHALLCVWSVDAGDVQDIALPDYDPDKMSYAGVFHPPHCNCQRAELQETPHRSHHGEIFLFPPFGVPMSRRPSQGPEGRESWSSHSPHIVFPANVTTKCIIVWHCPSPHKRHWQRSVNIGASGSSSVTRWTLLVESAQRHPQGRGFFFVASSARARRFSASFDIAPAIVWISTDGRADPDERETERERERHSEGERHKKQKNERQGRSEKKRKKETREPETARKNTTGNMQAWITTCGNH